MKMRVVFRTPCIMDVIADFFDDGEDDECCRKYEQEKKMSALAAKFVQGENYLVVEFDTEKETVEIIPLRSL